MTEALKPFPDERSCTAWEDCAHDGICHDPKNCGAVGPNHHAFYGISDDEAAALADMQPHERDTFHRMMGQRDVVKKIAEDQIGEGE